MKSVVISQPMLFPWVGMFEQVSLADSFVYYDDVQFSKGSFSNRVQIKTQNGPRWMSIPLGQRQLEQHILELKEDEGSDWRQSHLSALQQAYRRAPHRDDMLQLVEGVYAAEHASLCELLIASMESVRSYLQIDVQRSLRSSELEIEGSGSQRVLEIVKSLQGSVYYTGHGAAAYLDHQAFEDAGVRVEYMDYAKRPYPQLHPPFTPFVSVLDLIANVGHDGPSFLAPRTVTWTDWLTDE